MLLGALSVPPPPVMHLVDADIDPDKSKHERMAVLVGHSSVPQRKAIIHDLVAKNIMSNVPPELAEMYNFVETEFDPLNLSKRIKPLFAGNMRCTLLFLSSSHLKETAEDEGKKGAGSAT